jgi:hypothetical protein
MFDEPQVQHVCRRVGGPVCEVAAYSDQQSDMAPAHCYHRVKEEIPEHRDGTQSERRPSLIVEPWVKAE